MEIEMEILKIKAEIKELIGCLMEFMKHSVKESNTFKLKVDTIEKLMELNNKEIELQTIERELKVYNYFS